MNLPESEYKLKLKNHIVSFIDILGATNSIISESEKSLNLVHIAYEKAIETFNSLFKDKSITPTVKIFSDNILVSLPYNDKLKRPAFLAVAVISAIIQVQFLSFGYLTRGAISYGSFYCDNLMVWGQALVNAYRLESNNAIYPRVIVDPNLIDYLDIIKKGNDSKANQWIRKDKDSLFFVEYLNDYLKELEFFIIGQMELTDEQISKNSDNISICQKWLWYSNYLNLRFNEIKPNNNE